MKQYFLNLKLVASSNSVLKDYKMSTDIQNFYKNQIVFLTGGTGFLGKVVMEKLLRATEVQRIYVLIRKKRGKDIHERINDIFSDPLYQVLVKEKPHINHLSRVTPISGDCSFPNLGLSKEDREVLIRNVTIVVHSAATVRFTEPISVALEINVRATLDLINMSKEMPNLKCFLHVSSVFANCNEPHIDERFYTDNRSISGENACKMLEILGSDILDKIGSKLCGNFPNTYTFTKALAEEVIMSKGKELPICIFRPGIVIPTYAEPIQGWIDNMYGPTSILIGCAYGILRVLYARMHQDATIVPVDYCANALLACTWLTVESKQIVPNIYNFVPDPKNAVKWETYKATALTEGMKIPLSRMMWYPCLVVTESKTMYKIFCFLCHTIPAILFDFCLLVMGRKRRMVKIYKKLHKSSSLVHYFVENDWTFARENIAKLWTALSDEDKEMFPFQMSEIDWRQQFQRSVTGIRRYLAKEDTKTIPKGLKLKRRLLILHTSLQIALYSAGIILLLWIFSKIFQFKGIII